MKGWRWPWGPPTAFPCPILLTSKLPPLIILPTFQLESAPQGTPNAELISTSIWATLARPRLQCSPLPTIRLVRILHMACPAGSRQGPQRPGLGAHACSRQRRARSRAGFSPRCLNQQDLQNFFFFKKNTVLSLPVF